MTTTPTRDTLIGAGERLGLRQQERVRPARRVPDGGRATTNATRATLIGTGEHIAACLRLGADYTNAEYIEEVTAAREAGAGEDYANRVLGADVDARGVEADDGEAIVRAAELSL